MSQDHAVATSDPAYRGLARYLPILGWLPNYQRAWLRPDLIAGPTVVALLVPGGMAYAQIAGMPPQAAFYAAPIGLLRFAILGSSRQLIVAVSAAIATMSRATVSLIAQPNPSEFIVLTSMLAVLAAVAVRQRLVGAGLFLVLDHLLRAKEPAVVAQALVELLGRVGQDRRQDRLPVVHDAQDDVHAGRRRLPVLLDLEPGRLAVQG